MPKAAGYSPMIVITKFQFRLILTLPILVLTLESYCAQLFPGPDVSAEVSVWLNRVNSDFDTEYLKMAFLVTLLVYCFLCVPISLLGMFLFMGWSRHFFASLIFAYALVGPITASTVIKTPVDHFFGVFFSASLGAVLAISYLSSAAREFK